jgi:poly(3-hydroxybutyrate) depolymerase
MIVRTSGGNNMTPTTIPPSQDAAMVLGMASSAMLFADDAAGQAERWLRLLRLHGDVGAALQRLGVGEAPLTEGKEGESAEAEGASAETDAVDRVNEAAQRSAGDRGAEMVCTLDVLRGVIEVYGAAFDHTLEVRGTSRDELLERLDTDGS